MILKEFLANTPVDFAKLSILLYLLGLFSSAFYFSRYSILALDFARPQSIVIGTYIFLFYLVLPVSILASLKKVRSTRIQVVAFFLSLLIKNAFMIYLLSYRLLSLLILTLITSVFEFFLFAEFALLIRSLLNKNFVLRLNAVPHRIKVLIFTLIFSIHFAIFFFPLIPSYLGGAKPLRVHVFPRTPDLPSDRFVESKNRPKINKSIDSFALNLFYETDKDLYFLEERKSDDGLNLEGYSVMRLKRDEVLRIDYTTPKQVTLKGEDE